MYRSENSEKGGERESEGLPNGEKESAEDEDEENGVWVAETEGATTEFDFKNSVSGSCDEKIVTVTETITELTLLLSKTAAMIYLSGFVY